MRYALHGVVVASDASLPLLRSEPSASGALLRVEMGTPRTASPIPDDEVVYRLSRSDGTPLWTVARRGEDLLFRIHGDADFDLQGGRVRCHPLPDTSPARLEQLLVDQVLPRALHLQGRPCLHAAAVQRPSGEAVAFVADTGAGKSTLTAGMVARGGRLLSDDALAPTIQGDGVFVFPSYPSMRIWSDSATAIYGHHDFPTAARHHKCRVSSDLAGPAELSCLCLLLPDGTRPASAERLSPTESLRALAEAVHRLVPDDPDASAKEFEVLSSLVGLVPIYRLRFAHDYGQLASVIDLVEDLSSRAQASG